MIEKTFINPTTNKQWRIEIDGYTIRTCLNGGKVKAVSYTHLLVYFQKQAPESVLEHWNIWVGRQPCEGFLSLIHI